MATLDFPSNELAIYLSRPVHALGAFYGVAVGLGGTPSALPVERAQETTAMDPESVCEVLWRVLNA
jgi:hypothetical protein